MQRLTRATTSSGPRFRAKTAKLKGFALLSDFLLGSIALMAMFSAFLLLLNPVSFNPVQGLEFERISFTLFSSLSRTPEDFNGLAFRDSSRQRVEPGILAGLEVEESPEWLQGRGFTQSLGASFPFEGCGQGLVLKSGQASMAFREKRAFLLERSGLLCPGVLSLEVRK
ncbi:MAG TPA: hypothetical protein VJI67_02635 [archaeon]|nr:hypothetical protein [archaeon]HLD80442.1 hypothetical protein [archaeon]